MGYFNADGGLSGKVERVSVQEREHLREKKIEDKCEGESGDELESFMMIGTT